MNLIFEKKSYSFKLSSKVENSKTTYHAKTGWIIKLTSNDKKIGFGEVSPLLRKDLKKCAKQLNMIPENIGFGRLDHRSSLKQFYFCNASSGYAGFAGTIWTGCKLYEEITQDQVLGF